MNSPAPGPHPSVQVPGRGAAPSPGSARPGRRRGPTVMVVAGALTLAVALALLAGTVVLLTGILPTGVLTLDGRPGDAVVGRAEVPGELTVDLEEGTSYAVYLTSTTGTEPRLDADVEVVGPDGGTVAVRPDADVSGTVRLGGVTAVTVAGFTTDGAGPYTVRAPAPAGGGDGDGELLLTPDQPVVPFVLSVMGTVVGAMIGIVLGVVGIGLLVGGLVWRGNRRRDAVTP